MMYSWWLFSSNNNMLILTLNRFINYYYSPWQPLMNNTYILYKNRFKIVIFRFIWPTITLKYVNKVYTKFTFLFSKIHIFDPLTFVCHVCALESSQDHGNEFFFNLSVSKFLSSKFIAENFEEPLRSSLRPGN